MSCRETSAGSAFTTWARRSTGKVLSDSAVLSAFHELNRQHCSQGENAHIYTENEYYNLLLAVQREVQQYAARGNNVNSLQRRLQQAAGEPMPSQEVVYALFHIRSLVRERSRNLTQYIEQTAPRLGLTVLETWERFRTLEAGTPRSRSQRPETYTEINRNRAIDYGLGQDVAIVNAVARLEEEAAAIEIARFRFAPQLITQNDLPARFFLMRTSEYTVFLTSYGYDNVSRRLEVTTRRSDGTEQRFAYRDVPPPVDLNTLIRTWHRDIHGNPDHQYASELEEARAGVANRCDMCGQYATSGHTCPVGRPVQDMTRYSTTSRWSRQTVTMPFARYDTTTQAPVVEDREIGVLLPAIREFRAAVAAGPVRVDVGWGTDHFIYLLPWTRPNGTSGVSLGTCFVSGSTLISRDPDTNELTVDITGLRCTCTDYRETHTCPHVDGYGTAIRNRIDPPVTPRVPRARRPRMTNEERERVLVEAQARSEALAAQTDWMLDEAGKTEAASTWIRQTDVLYSEDYAAYQEDIEAALERSAAKGGGPAIPYMRENVLDGYCRRSSGQAFGMEIEFDIKPEVNKHEALAAIATDLYEAGITFAPEQVRYGTSRRRGFIDTHADTDGKGTWSFETDGSVDAELVTPGMYDEPETWEKLELATEIIRRHGGVPSKRAGAHVHVGTSNFRGNVGAYAEMARILNQHEDVVYRLAANPERGTHRNTGYAIPMPSVPAEGYTDIMRFKHRFHRRYSAINFGAIAGGPQDHPEYRLWDSSLDPGTMQAQIKMSVFMKEAALRHVQQGLVTTREKEPSGSHQARFKARGTRVALTAAEEEADSRTIRSFFDTICRRREDKAQLASLVPFTKWGKQRRSG